MASQGNITQLEIAFEGLSTEGTVFATLSALFGAYTILFVIAMWATFKNKSLPNTRLRVINISLFVVLLTHYIARGVMYSQRRSMFQPADAPFGFPKFSIPGYFVASLTTTLAGLLTDGFLAWRFSVIFGRTKWTSYVPMLAVVINGFLGVAGDFQIITFYSNPEKYWSHFEEVSFMINAAWGWVMLGTNTVLTAMIIGRILYVSKLRPANAYGVAGDQYSTLVAAMVESALVTWVGLLLLGIANVAPHGHITTHMDIGFIMMNIIPVFFGISQCLMIVQLAPSNALPFYASDFGVQVGGSALGHEEMGIRIQCEVHTDAKPSSGIGSESTSELDVKSGPCGSDRIVSIA